MQTLSAEQLNNIGKQSGYTGGNFSSVGLSAPAISNTMDASALQSSNPLSVAPKTQSAIPDISTLTSAPATTAPAGWDAETYANFKKANPTLEPNAQDTARMLAADSPKAPGLAQKLTSSLSNLFTSSKNKETDLASTTESATQPYTSQLNEINTQIKNLQAKSIQNQEKALQSGETTGFASREAQNVARTDAIQGLFLQAQAEGMQGNIALAETHVKNAIDAKYADMDKQIDEARQNIYNNYDSFTPAEKKQADATLLKIDTQDQFVKTAKEDDQIQQGFIQEAISQSAKNGTPVPNLVLQRANQAASPTEALQILAPYMVDADAKASALLDRQIKQANLTKLNAEIKQLNPGIGNITNPEAAKFAGALSVILGSGKFTKDQKNDVVNAINNGQDPFSVVKNQAKNIMGQTEATKLTNYEVARDTLNDIGTQLQEFYDKGGSTGLVKGTLEDFANNLGKVKDVNLVNLATQIKGNLAIYRNAISGTAYSAQEGKDINSIFPGINKSQTLNSAILSARNSLFDSVIDSSYRTALGSSYDTLKKAESTANNVTKGNLTDGDFVGQALSKQNVSYADALKAVPAGYIGAIDNTTGELVQMLPSDFDASKYTKL